MEKAVLKNLEIAAYEMSQVDFVEKAFGKNPGDEMLVASGFVSNMLYTLKDFIEHSDGANITNEKFFDAIHKYMFDSLDNARMYHNGINGIVEEKKKEK